MKLKINGFLTLLFALMVQISFAQTVTVSGTVTDEDGLPLPGVNILVKGGSSGTQSDFDGNYSIRVDQDQTLTYRYIGFKTQEVKVGNQTQIDVSLTVDSSELDEVVVIGNITESRETSTASSVKLSSKTIENRPNTNVVQTLNGQVSGLNITTNSGQPGSSPLVQIRGVGSINGDTEPLFIIDGIPVDAASFRSLNPQEIESIEVLKDASATAIYGNRGANGVIVIQTRRGGFEKKLSVQVNSIFSFSSLQNEDYNIMSSQQLLRYERDRGIGAGAGNSTSVFNPGQGQPMTDEQIENAPNFSWEDFFFRTGVTQNHTIALSGGGKNISQYTSVGFNETEGILQNSKLKRFNFRNNLDGKSDNGKFKYSSNVSVNYSENDQLTSIGTSGINQNFILGAFESVPYVTSGDYTTGADLLSPLSFTNTPLFLQDKLNNSTRVDEEMKIVAGLNLSYEITDWLSANLTLGADYENRILLNTLAPSSFNALLFGGDENPTSGFQSQNTRRQFKYNQITSLNFNKSFDKHEFTLGLYSEYAKFHLRQFGYTADGLNPSTFFPGDGAGLIGTRDGLFVDTANAAIRNAGLFSYFANFNYDYDRRYGLSASIRRDATNRFVDDNKWGTFYSIGARWNISNEAFMDDSPFNTLKLRASYGETGNQFITGTIFGGLDLTENFFTSTGGYRNQNSLQLSQVGNPNLQWETIAQSNVAIDFGLWNNRLRGSFEVYEKETQDLFQPAPVSATAGITSINQNVGSLFNRGIDYSVTYDFVRAKSDGDFNLSLGALGNFNETEIQNIPNEQGEIIRGGGTFSVGLGRNGGQLYEYYGLSFAGVNPANGNLLYYTADGNVTENPDTSADADWLGKNILPAWTGSLILDVEYKNFFLSTQWSYATDVYRVDNLYASITNPDRVGQFNYSADILNAWSQPGDVTNLPSPSATNRNSFGSDRFLEKADFMRMRFASFGYNFPQEFLAGTGLDRLSLFLNGENLITFSEWRGYDPETRNADFGGGVSTGRGFPTPRIVSFGLELSF